MSDRETLVEVTQADRGLWEPSRLRKVTELRPAFAEWFFRDLGETQRRQLFNWCGFPGVEANGRDLQESLLNDLLRALTHPTASKDATPSPQVSRELLCAREEERELIRKAAEND